VRVGVWVTNEQLGFLGAKHIDCNRTRQQQHVPEPRLTGDEIPRYMYAREERNASRLGRWLSLVRQHVDPHDAAFILAASIIDRLVTVREHVVGAHRVKGVLADAHRLGLLGLLERGTCELHRGTRIRITSGGGAEGSREEGGAGGGRVRRQCASLELPCGPALAVAVVIIGRVAREVAEGGGRDDG
jgi:hypothetical protein